MIQFFLFYLLSWCTFIFSNTTNIVGTQTQCTQTLSYTIPSSLAITVTGTPELTFTQPKAGENFSPVTATATYLLSCNKTNYHIDGKISTLIPDIILTARLTPPSGASTLGDVHLTLTDQVLVSGITKTKIQNGLITYTMAPADQNILPSEISGGTVTVTFTLCS